MAAVGGHLECVEALLAVGGIDANHANQNGNAALSMASQKGHTDVVRTLLAVDGIDANHANDNGWTALIFASQNDHAEVVRTLLAVDGIDANHADNVGSTALICASQEGHAEVVGALLAVDGLDTNHFDADDDSALMLAVAFINTSCVRALVAAKGIRVNLQSPKHGNCTALHDACKDLHGATRTEMVGLLLTAGGCRFQLNDDGQTPLDLAGGDKHVSKLFASGVDYWQRRRHGGHAWAMKAAVTTLLLVRQRLGRCAAPTPAPPAPAQGRALRSSAARAKSPARPPAPLPHLPEEIWLAACAFLRSADFLP